jgi:nucleoside diphosphate kinase
MDEFQVKETFTYLRDKEVVNEGVGIGKIVSYYMRDTVPMFVLDSDIEIEAARIESGELSVEEDDNGMVEEDYVENTQQQVVSDIGPTTPRNEKQLTSAVDLGVKCDANGIPILEPEFTNQEHEQEYPQQRQLHRTTERPTPKPQISASPVVVMLDKAKKAETELQITLKVELPNKSLVDVISANFDNSEEDIISYLIDNMDKDELNKSLRASLKDVFYPPSESTT